MKHTIFLLALLLAACSPSAGQMQTAIAETQAVQPQATAASATAQPADTDEPTLIPTDTARPTDALTPTPDNEQSGRVVRVLDGDTIDVEINGEVFRVRYIGVNTPEKGEVCASDATTANVGLVYNQTVRLVKDVSETDPYDRLLRYVYVGDEFVNAVLVKQGWAEAVAYPPDTAQADYFESLEAEARAAGRGCHPTGIFGGGVIIVLPTNTPMPQVGYTPVPTQAPLPTEPPTVAPVQNCDPSYPGVCIPPYPPDLDCGQISYRRFQVLPPDPHGFDGDHDGIGCESG